jgi:hypothetical protein
LQEIKKLLSEIAKVSSKHQYLSEVSGNNFNVFSVINVTTDEVRLHSRFLAELLNPNGSHGQKDIFLKMFTDKFEIKMDTEVANVKVEKHIGTVTETTGGFIDVFIWDKKGSSITIENKIYAKDQENQLLRYYNYNKNNLFYLTLFGDEPSEKSYINKNVDPAKIKGKTKLDPEKDFQIISYRDHIKDWLIACRKEAVELPLLREGISHYINLIETLTGQSSNDIMNKEIKNKIASSEESLKNAILIEENIKDVKIGIQWKFWEVLKENFKEKLKTENLELVEDLSVSKKNVEKYYATRNRDVYFGFWVRIYSKNGITIHFGIELENEIYFGFTLERDGAGGNALAEENSNFRNMALKTHPSYKSSQYWIAYRFSEWKLDFRAFNSKSIFELADDKKMEKKVSLMCENMIKDIRIFK